MRFHLSVVVALLVGRLPGAVADPTTARYVVAEAPAAIAMSDAHDGVFRPGVMPALGVYVENARMALGLRLRAGILRDGAAPGDNLADPGVGGLTTAGVAVRFGVRGAWFELVAGGGVTGRDLVPSVEAGIGWLHATGDVAIGPSVRYVRVISRDGMDAFGSADLALVGLDLRFGGAPSPRPPRPAAPPPRVVAAPPSPAPAPVAIEVARDPDVIIEREPSCAVELEGCQLTEDLLLVDDRIVLDDRVLFDTDRARVKSRGRAVVADLVRIWGEHPEWRTIIVEGHADVRGSDEYNLWLSQLRADRVRTYMIKLGADAARITAIGYGRSRPRAPGTDAQANQRNRRVEFVIERGGAR